MRLNLSKPDFKSMAEKWPSSHVSREKVSQFTGGILNPRTLANIDCKGEGPERIRIGRKIAYKVEDLCDWLSERASHVDNHKG